MTMSPHEISRAIFKLLTGKELKKRSIINFSRNTNCDISFPIPIIFWKEYIEKDNILGYETIFDYYILIHGIKDFIWKDFVLKLERIGDNLIHVWKDNLTVYIKYNRDIVTLQAIKKAILEGSEYGRKEICEKYFKLKVEEDFKSEITNMRLQLLKDVSTNFLKSQGLNTTDDEKCDNKYLYSTKSHNRSKTDYNIYLCGVTLINNKKDSCVTAVEYTQNKMNKIAELNNQKCLNVYTNKQKKEEDIQKIVRASINYELLSVKHTSPVTLNIHKGVDVSVKEASFILYNNVRITAILEKYANLVQQDELSDLIPLEELEPGYLCVDNEIWCLIYNYIMKYPGILESCVTITPKFEIDIHILWNFLSSMCHDFSKFYSSNRILMNSFCLEYRMEKLSQLIYMIMALQVVLRNVFTLLGIEEVEYM